MKCKQCATNTASNYDVQEKNNYEVQAMCNASKKKVAAIEKAILCRHITKWAWCSHPTPAP